MTPAEMQLRPAAPSSTRAADPRRALLAALSTVRSALRSADSRVAIMLAASTALGWFVAAAAIDALLGMSDAMRMALTLAGVVVTLATTGMFVLRSARSSDAAALSRRIDRVGPAVVRTGTDLHAADARDPLTAGLAALAIARATTVVEATPSAAIRDARSARRAAGALAVLAVTWIGIAMISPRLAGIELLRFVDPHGDHPPYSRLSFSISPGAATVAFGHALDVTATVDGGTPASIALVSRTLPDGPTRSTPMVRSSGTTWQATLPAVVAPTQYYVQAGSARSKRATVGVVTLPRVESVEMTLTPPAYSRRPSTSGLVPGEGIHALAGTKVQLRVHSNRPLLRGSMGGDVVAPLVASSDDPTSADGSFVIRDGAVQLRLIDRDGQASEQPFSVRLTADQDAPPRVRIVSPLATSYATPDAMIDVEVVADDDLGVAALTLDRSLNGSPPSPLRFEVGTSLTHVDAHTALTLADLGLHVGDTITLTAHAADASPDAGHSVESELAVVHIVSHAELDQRLLARDGAEAIVGRYATAERVARDALRAATQPAEFAKRASSAADLIDSAAARPLPVALDSALTPKLRSLADALHAAARASDSSGSDGGSKTLLTEVDQFHDSAVAPAERFAATLPFATELRRLRATADAQQTLVGAIRQPATAPAGTRRQFAATQASLHRAFVEAVERLDAASRTLGADQTDLRKATQTLVEKARSSGVEASMRQSEERLAALDPASATPHAQAAVEALQALMGSSSPALDAAVSASLRADVTTASAANQSLEQLAAASTSSDPSDAKADVGLYGLDRLTSGRAAVGGGPPAERGAAAHDNGAPPATNPVARFQQQWQYQASGAAAAPVPPAYRERVDAYFRRVVDELQGGPK